MTPLRVAIDATATPLGLTGAGYYVVEIIRELATREEIDLTVITRKSDKERFVKLGSNIHVLNVAPDNKIQRVLYQALRLGKLVDSLGVDIFHGPHYQLPLKMKTPSVVTIHDMTLITHPHVHSKSKRVFFSRIIPQSVKHAKSIVAVSQHTADDIAAAYGNLDNVFVAPLAADRNRFNEKVLPTDLELLHARGVTTPYIAFLGLLEPRKCIPTLVHAFVRIADDYPDHTLVIAGGNGWGLEDIREAIADSGVRTRIVQTGRLSEEEVPALFRHADVFVYPSMYEGLGLPILEAMSCGAPTITTQSSSLSEVAGDAAVLVEPENAVQLADAITSILSDKKLSAAYSDLGIARAHEFTWSACADSHLDAYRIAAD